MAVSLAIPIGTLVSSAPSISATLVRFAWGTPSRRSHTLRRLAVRQYGLGRPETLAVVLRAATLQYS